MKIYGISGLGADERVFEYLTLNYELIPVTWIKPKENEQIEPYAARLAEAINCHEPYGILGVSFGGLIAVEISKILNPEVTILISSAETRGELKPLFRIIGRLGLIRWLPSRLFDLPGKVANFLFGAKNKVLLANILKDTDPGFARWAVNELVRWKNETRVYPCLKIGGTKDKLMPAEKSAGAVHIQGGEHFMIVDRAREISEIINKRLG